MRKAVFLYGLLLSIILIPLSSPAQQYPTKPINMVVAFSPGGADFVTRVLANKTEKLLGQPFIISNNGAGGGSVALGVLAKERPDGYHLVSAMTTFLTLTPHFRAVPYRYQDFVPVMSYGSPSLGLAVKADSPWKTLKEFLDYAKQNPGKVTYSTGGAGTAMHIAMEYVGKQEGIKWTHVPYPGGPAALPPLLGGHVTAAFTGGTDMLPHVQAGTVRPLVFNSEKRIKTYPNVPTFKELGYDVISETLSVILAPKGTPQAIVKKLQEVFQKGMDDPEFTQAMEKTVFEIKYRNSEEMTKYVEEAYVRLGKRVTELKIAKEPEKK